MAVFWEPCWETGKNVWWSFRRADGDAFGLAGLWNTWMDRATGEVYESYTMLTINADAPPMTALNICERAPVAIHPDYWKSWLSPEVTTTAEVTAMVDRRLLELAVIDGARGMVAGQGT